MQKRKLKRLTTTMLEETNKMIHEMEENKGHIMRLYHWKGLAIKLLTVIGEEEKHDWQMPSKRRK